MENKGREQPVQEHRSLGKTVLLWIFGIFGGIFILLFLAFLVIGALWSGVLYWPAPEEQNVFDEIYGSDMFVYSVSTTPMEGQFWLKDVFHAPENYEYAPGNYSVDQYVCDPSAYPSMSAGDEMSIIVDQEADTLTFRYVHAATEESPEATSVYIYAFRKKWLCYASTLPSGTEPDPFLWELLLPAWMDNTQGYSDFSYGAWGEYTLVRFDGGMLK